MKRGGALAGVARLQVFRDRGEFARVVMVRGCLANEWCATGDEVLRGLGVRRGLAARVGEVTSG